ncbi:hypothetical protein [Xanthomonas sacchari]|uniref:hypothetical protein n=1 Tax=Xanthomonas sacchari TaxID=56458 RepID=UPI002259A2DA|nr:hypothetical protein [Xanthomonas sacchari]MCW0447232.1 hypothetical protein [Xanthomonas sacchari]
MAFATISTGGAVSARGTWIPLGRGSKPVVALEIGSMGIQIDPAEARWLSAELSRAADEADSAAAQADGASE